ncbi:hypothetical protein AB0B31_11040 [Catellatospora citrea]|uniref:hypothetical protein n=1 Tax=Catellatospora citrea TaxID=53366 RepID=UPI0033D94B2B
MGKRQRRRLREQASAALLARQQLRIAQPTLTEQIIVTLQLACGHTVEHHNDGWIPAAVDCPDHGARLIAHIDAISRHFTAAKHTGNGAWQLGPTRTTTWRQRLARLRPRYTEFTVTICGTERLDGEKPYDYVVRARHAAHAITKAVRQFLTDQEEPFDALTTSSLDRLPEIHISGIAAGAPAYPVDTPGRYWNDVRTRRPRQWLTNPLGRSS